MNMIKLLPIFVLLVFAAGCAQEGAEQIETQEEIQTPQEEASEETAPAQVAPPEEEIERDLEFDIIFSKETYTVGEEVGAEHVLKNHGESFEGIVAYKIEREGFEKAYRSYMQNPITESTPTMVLGAAEIDENGYYGATDSFPYPGTYIYSMKVYDCVDIEAEFGYCDLFDLEESEFAEITPVGEFSKSIEVVESS